ncbi:hypothetical protein Vau01_124780 [Virgisporangium aurantiacum]|uniref:Uncharacterized protein n=2 Tax=Virgisporangium aurantiacum TaxID=175570 RepID=A0A8J4EAN5_9ACTN|nr:hypothetical protein Vau01_124780 [Virgisporangium aurantiacum]
MRGRVVTKFRSIGNADALWRRHTRPSDSAFVLADTSPEAHAQYDRITALVRLGRVVLSVGSGVILLALVLGSVRGHSTLGWFFLLPGALVLTLAFVLVDLRLTARPPGTTEVPGDLAEELCTLREFGNDIVLYTAETLPAADYERITRATNEHLAATIATAARVLAADRSGDLDTSARLRTRLVAYADGLRDAHEALVPRPDDDPAEPPLQPSGRAASTGEAHHTEAGSDEIG